MRKIACTTLLVSLALLSVAGQEAKAAPAPASVSLPADGFRTEGSLYVATGSGKGATVSEAEGKARTAAMRELFAGLGKDRLFAEIFMGSPPLSLNFGDPTTIPEESGFSASITLRIDDESVRIVERGPYLAAAISLLDKADQTADDATAASARAAEAEAQASLGDALGAYGMAQDGAQSALVLIDPVADASIFSSKGKRTATELKRSLEAIRDGAIAGIERVRKAEAALAADATGKASEAVIESSLAAAEAAQALLDGSAPLLQDLSSQDSERLVALRDRLAQERRSLADSQAALERAAKALPEDRRYLNDKVEFARRRLATADSSVADAYRSVDREIRDPAARRAARSRAIRWALLHEPREFASLRLYLPFGLEAGNPEGLELAPLQLRAGLEGAFPMGRGGVWVRSVADLQSTDLDTDVDDSGEEWAFSQSFDFGFYGRTLFFGGFSWDWLRKVEPEAMDLPARGLVKLGIGGVSRHSSEGEEYGRADWLLSLNYQIPYDSEESLSLNAINAGLEGQFRLGTIALLEASASHRLHKVAEGGEATDFAAVFRWAIGLGIRVPSPFAWGIEYGGDAIWPLRSDGSHGDLEPFDGGRFRFFLQYSI